MFQGPTCSHTAAAGETNGGWEKAAIENATIADIAVPAVDSQVAVLCGFQILIIK
tara:strand:+ start:19 stop:183 length:165 start_codon:yes stop_codon:yes gene_type:complete